MRPPGAPSRSNTSTAWPARARRHAHASPATPPPTTITRAISAAPSRTPRRGSSAASRAERAEGAERRERARELLRREGLREEGAAAVAQQCAHLLVGTAPADQHGGEV